MELRYKPHRLTNGLGNVALVNNSCVVRAVLTATGDNSVSLRLYDASGGSVNAVDSRLEIWAPSHQTVQITTDMAFSTGITASASATGCVATIFIRNRSRDH